MRGVQWFLLRFMQCRIEPDCTVPAFPASQGCPICNTPCSQPEFPSLGYHTWAKRILTDGVAPMENCRCTSKQHGHPLPCPSPATEGDKLCKPCHDAAAEETAETKAAGSVRYATCIIQKALISALMNPTADRRLPLHKLYHGALWRYAVDVLAWGRATTAYGGGRAESRQT